MLDPRLLRAFVAIADNGSFTVAAEKLHMTQSTISQQLGRLEQVVGRELIDRAARPVRPTASGERLLGYSRRILTLQHEAETLLADPAGTSSIRIGVPEDIVTVEMARIFAGFAKRHREIRLDVTTGLSRDLSKRYRDGEFDVVVIKEPSPGDDHRATFPEAIAWFESASFAVEWPDPLPLVAFPPGGLYRDAMFERIEQDRRRWYIAFSGSSLQSVLVAVEAGMGLSLLPVGTTTGRRVRRYAGFGPEPSMVVSIYSWEPAGAVGELVESMGSALAERFIAASAQ
ncbi:LysR family transcriptional regulator [Paradevosia shaoguanensis]|uniref:LysR family transcriptional regulator n=1 Tax=Paradevosia shaoguanensis TaxID=1335043 RepID=A0AA41QLT4_9HYPH|nr:LysR family transcriptional regulator [Paradevosia shaoguanensis]MCF1741373.1 LysR family transcriptional regulator [Paradevosia shaoguanensis]MCI0125856.1 LysR family transcriptional regulator [Paradevosia shaoguanensis]QMV03239.1 LysR family transcriptional regulator [Devosia sp. D6-9]